jgi:hypothetical protein
MIALTPEQQTALAFAVHSAVCLATQSDGQHQCRWYAQIGARAITALTGVTARFTGGEALTERPQTLHANQTPLAPAEPYTPRATARNPAPEPRLPGHAWITSDQGGPICVDLSLHPHYWGPPVDPDRGLVFIERQLQFDDGELFTERDRQTLEAMQWADDGQRLLTAVRSVLIATLPTLIPSIARGELARLAERLAPYGDDLPELATSLWNQRSLHNAN